MIVHWLVTLGYLLPFLFLLKRSRLLNDETLPFTFIAMAFTAKVICGILYGYLDAYSGQRGGDSMNYFWDANWMFNAFHENKLAYVQMLTGIHDSSREIYLNYYQFLITWKVNDFDYFFNDSHTIVRLHAFIRLFSFGIYNVHVIVFNFLSFIGLLLLYKTFRHYLPKGNKILLALLFFLPSSLVWYSAALKEPLVMLGLGILVWQLHRVSSGKIRAVNIAGLFGAVILLLAIRFYVLLCLVPAVLVWWWLSKNPAKPLLKAVAVALILLVAIFCTELFSDEYKISRILHDQLMNSVKQVEYYHPEKKVSYVPIDPSFADILVKAPAAFLKTATTPCQHLISDLYRLPFFAENILVLLLAGYVMLRFRKPDIASLPFLFFSLFFVGLLYVLIGLTTPYDGTIIRYRSVTLPFVLFLLLSFHRAGDPGSEKKFTS